jgi:SAM-dependent methyltransferase
MTQLPNQSLAAADWASARGEKWSTQLSGMEATLHPVDDPLIDALDLQGPMRIAEVGCGGGGTSLELLRRSPAGSVVHGFDISPKLVEGAKRRVSPDERCLTFEVADMATTAPKEPYDRLVSRFGIMFFDEPEAAFSNLARWLEPGGRFAFAVWGKPSENVWMKSVRDAVAQVVEVPKADPDAPGPFRYADSSKLLSLLEEAGFASPSVREWRGQLPIGGRLAADAAAHFMLSAFSNFGELLTEAGGDALGEAQRLLAQYLSDHQRDGGVRLGASVSIVTGSRR